MDTEQTPKAYFKLAAQYRKQEAEHWTLRGLHMEMHHLTMLDPTIKDVPGGPNYKTDRKTELLNKYVEHAMAAREAGYLAEEATEKAYEIMDRHYSESMARIKKRKAEMQTIDLTDD